ncbi:galactose-3-O-sulfotransferase 3-like [Nothobranchius furzeri]|uniref:Galactose-3-O-sulfotransferase 3-like n=2 Tax=Nothobranchius furzeri TaxID=105023 RepID=A0A9D2Z1H7_NOTFU|nr:galactose-3-O-sulfotransferase 3-like [Nothobranchius furzeri]
MPQKKIFVVLLLVCTVSLVVHNRNFFSWTWEAIHLEYSAQYSHTASDVKPKHTSIAFLETQKSTNSTIQNMNMDVFHLGSAISPRNNTQHLKPKHTNVVFLKTHKTAGTTVQNMLFRFCERNGLTMALPSWRCDHQFCYPQFFSSQFVHPNTLPANMISNHMRFNENELKRLMPYNTKYITILREPASTFESLFTYYSAHAEAFRRVPGGSLEAFLADPLRYYQRGGGNDMYARNTLTFDLGGDKDRPSTDVAYAKAFVEEVERVFSLVMISEYFDESLVLLRHLLSWDLEDILYVKLNMRTERSKKSLSPGLREKIRAWNSIDTHLYDYFNASFWVKLSKLGLDYVAKEVSLLQQAQERLMNSCFNGTLPVPLKASEIKNKELRPWQPNENVDILGYELPSNISSEAKRRCLKYILPEVPYTTKLLYSQIRQRFRN